MDRHTLLVALFAVELVIVVLAVQAVRCCAGSWPDGSWHRGGWMHPEPVPTTLSLAADSLVSATITAPGASVALSPSRDDRVRVWANASEPRLHLERNGDEAVVRLDGGRMSRHVSESLKIELPAQMRVTVADSADVLSEGMKSDLVLHAADGSAIVGDHRGNVSISNSYGRIQLDRVKGDRLDLRTNNGRVYVGDSDTNVLTIASGNGRVVISSLVLHGTAPRLEAMSRNGRFEIGLKQLPSDGTYMGHTDNGPMRLQLPADSNVTVTMRTRNGTISGTGVTLSGEGNERHAVLGSGTAPFEFSTGNGRITLTAGSSE